MKCIRTSTLLFLMPVLSLSMERALAPPANGRKKRMAELTIRIDQLKKALFEKASPDVIQKILDDMRPLVASWEEWSNVIQKNKALIIANAESAARFVDPQVQNLVRGNKPVPAELQEAHCKCPYECASSKRFYL